MNMLSSCTPDEIDTADFTFQISLSGDYESFDKIIEIIPYDFNLSNNGRTSVTPTVTTSDSEGIDNEFVSTLNSTAGLSVFVKGSTTVELTFNSTTNNEDPIEMAISIIISKNGEVVDTITEVFDTSSTDNDRILRNYFVND